MVERSNPATVGRGRPAGALQPITGRRIVADLEAIGLPDAARLVRHGLATIADAVALELPLDDTYPGHRLRDRIRALIDPAAR